MYKLAYETLVNSGEWAESVLGQVFSLVKRSQKALLRANQKPEDELTFCRHYKGCHCTDHFHKVGTESLSSSTLAVPDSIQISKSKQRSIGIKKFNMDPKKGVEYLVLNELIVYDPQDVAEFLFKGEALSKTAIGNYLGENHDFNLQVLKEFVSCHDFKDLLIVQALRQFLWSFRLPGESQKIDRMLEEFATNYCKQNTSVFKHPDTCFVLSYAIVMLNTVLHNPAVKEKITLETFYRMNDSYKHEVLSKEFIESLYDNIKSEPFQSPVDDGNDLMQTFFHNEREGWLWKQGGRHKSWKRRWFILNNNCLYYFEYTTDKNPKGIIPLENIELRTVDDRSKSHCFELYSKNQDRIKACKTDSMGRFVESRHYYYRMSALSAAEREEWMKAVRKSISHNPLNELLSKLKKTKNSSVSES